MVGSLSTFTFFYLLFFLIPSINGDCSYSSCASNIYPKDQIPFPFRTSDQPLTCGLPGFDLFCNSSTKTPFLSLPSGQSFNVENIEESFNRIWISDPQKCLPTKLLHTLNTSGTPFRFKSFTRFSLHNCPSTARLPNFYPSSPCSSVSCGGATPYSVVCVNKSFSFSDYGCQFVGDTMVPGVWAYPFRFASASSVALNWDLPRACRRCKGKCYRSGEDTSDIKCNVFTKGVITSITFASIVTIIVISYVLCKCCKRLRRGVTNTDQTHSNMNRQSNVTSGALRDTLDTYPIIVVGESGRMLSIMEDKTCPICLSDYASKDILKTLPECLHKFHSECIDEWLITKLTCPICRTPPPLGC